MRIKEIIDDFYKDFIKIVPPIKDMVEEYNLIISLRDSIQEKLDKNSFKSEEETKDKIEIVRYINEIIEKPEIKKVMALKVFW